MKKIFTLLIALTTMAMGAQAQVAINETNFPDENFRNWLLDANNINGYGADGTLTSAEIADVKEIIVTKKGIKDLKGIEHFTALESLRCGHNDITTLDLSKNTKLKELSIWHGTLTSIDVSMLPELEIPRLRRANT